MSFRVKKPRSATDATLVLPYRILCKTNNMKNNSSFDTPLLLQEVLSLCLFVTLLSIAFSNGLHFQTVSCKDTHKRCRLTRALCVWADVFEVLGLDSGCCVAAVLSSSLGRAGGIDAGADSC